jgi:hypothetical protein
MTLTVSLIATTATNAAATTTASTSDASSKLPFHHRWLRIRAGAAFFC